MIAVEFWSLMVEKVKAQTCDIPSIRSIKRSKLLVRRWLAKNDDKKRS